MMKKIIAAINASSFSEKKLLSFMDCANWAEGQFLLALLDTDTSIPVVQTYEGVGYFGYTQVDWKSLKEKLRDRAEKVERFLDTSHDHGLRTSTLHNRTITFEELVKEARFADLVMIDSSIPLSPVSGDGISGQLQLLLREAACPVLILRDGAIDIEELIFTYNGTPSSVYAIKQFTQLFPSLSEKPVTVLYVNENGNGSVPEHENIMGYLQYHYNSIGIRVLKGNPSYEIISFLKNKRTALVTFGAYGRNSLSRFFHPSEADNILKTLKLPVFITHL
jgi:nucleotide-binding universal stress UspA family protein